MERTLYVWQNPGSTTAYSNDVSAVLPVVSCRRLRLLPFRIALLALRRTIGARFYLGLPSQVVQLGVCVSDRVPTI